MLRQDWTYTRNKSNFVMFFLWYATLAGKMLYAVHDLAIDYAKLHVGNPLDKWLLRVLEIGPGLRRMPSCDRPSIGGPSHLATAHQTGIRGWWVLPNALHHICFLRKQDFHCLIMLKRGPQTKMKSTLFKFPRDMTLSQIHLNHENFDGLNMSFHQTIGLMMVDCGGSRFGN